MAMTDWVIIRRSMLARLFSTVTTIITVAVAVALMLVLLSMRDAGERAFSRGAGNMHLLVSAEKDPMGAVLNGIFYARPPREPIPWNKFLELSAWVPWQDPAKGEGYEDGFFIPIQQGDSFRGFPVLATTEAFFTRFTPVPGGSWTFKQGKRFSADYEVVIGSAVEAATGLKLGDAITLTHGMPASTGGGSPHEHSQFRFTVVGVLSPTGTSHDRGVFVGIQSAWILHAHDRIEREEAAEAANAGKVAEHEDEHLPTAADLKDEDRKMTGIYLRLVTRTGSNTSSALQGVFDRLRKDPILTPSQPSQEIGNLFKIVGNINQILVAMAAVVIASSGIAIMLALYNSMEQRRRQIAVLRVLGCSQGRIFSLVLTESALLGAFGTVAGIGLAALGGFLVAVVMKHRLGLVVEPGLTPMWVVRVAVGTVLLAAASGIVPAVMAYRTSVARNLRPLG